MTNEKKKNVVRLFLTKFIRLDDVIKWSAISFIGFVLGMSTFSIQANILPLLVFLLTTFCILAYTFSINNYYDADSDRENPRRMHSNALASGEISKKTGIAMNILFIVISLLVSLLYKREVFFFSVLLVFWMTIYSVPPLRLKGRPGVDVIWHFFAFFFLIIWGSLIAGSLQPINWLVAVSIGVFSCIGQVWNHYVDFAFDKESGTTTFAVRVGLEWTKKTIHLLLGIHIILLLPLVLLYSIHYLITLLIIIIGLILGFILIRPKRGGFPEKKSFEYYAAVVGGGSIYISCLVYYLFSLLGITLTNII